MRTPFLILALVVAVPALADVPPAPSLAEVELSKSPPALEAGIPAIAPVAPNAPPVIAPGIPHVEEDAIQFAIVLVNLLAAGRFGAFALILLFGLVGILRWALKKIELTPSSAPAWVSVVTALRSTWGGWGINFAFALSGGFATTVYFNLPMIPATIAAIFATAVSYALGAAGLAEFRKDLTAKRNAAADLASSKASSEVGNLSDAAAVLRKGPPEA